MIRLKSQDIYVFMGNKSDIVKYSKKWYKTLAGQYALEKLDGFCIEVMSEIFGYYAIETGVLSGQHDLLKHSRIATSFSLAANENNANLVLQEDPLKDFALITKPESLPISTDDVDLVVASHVLETTENPHQVLREIDRVLVPEGHCILIGFNPFALSHAGIKLKSVIQRDKHQYKMRSVNRVRDWLSLLGFEVLDVSYMGCRPSVKNQKLFDGLSWMEKLGEYSGALLGSMYVVHAKKQVIAMRPDKPVWKAPAVLKGGKVALNRTAQRIRKDNYSKL